MVETTIPPSRVHIISCPTCSAKTEEGTAFCQQCGHRLLGHLGEKQHRKIRSARIAIMLVSLLTMFSATAFWMLLQGEIQKVESDPSLVINEAVVSQARLVIFATFGVGLLFLGLFFWAKRNPFAASLTALIAYFTTILAGAAIDPTTLAKGWLVKLIVIAVLTKGVKAGLAFNKLQEQRGGS